MKRWTKVAVLAAVGLGAGLVSQAWAQGIPGKTKEEDKLRFYVLAEIRGLDVVCSKMTSVEQVKQKTAELDREAAETNKKNAELRKEIAELNKKLPGLKALKGLKKEEAEKEQVEREIEQVESSIKEKQEQIKNPVAYQVRGAFSKSEDADAVMNQLEAQSRAAKERAAKEAAAKEKAGKK